MKEFKQWHDEENNFYRQFKLYFSQCNINQEIMLSEILALTSDTAVEDFHQRGITFDVLKENEIDLILTDIRMPIMDGQEMTEKIRHLNRNDAKTIPIIAITANILDDDIKIYHKSGINDFVEKPIKPDVLYKVLANTLNEKRD